MKKLIPLVVFSVVFFSQSAFAHPGHDHAGFVAGFWHPVFGLDHLLVALGVGLWAAQSKGSSVVALPASFLTALIVGALAGHFGFALPFGEEGLLLSVAMIGFALVVGARLPIFMSIPLVAGIALFHGNAHGVEMGIDQAVVPYFLGLVGATAVLHAVGIALNLALDRFLDSRISRVVPLGL